MRKINIKCYKCKEDFVTEPYFSKPRIITADCPLTLSEWNEAVVEVRALCPHCGNIIIETCKNDIYPEDIVDLAIRRYKRED